MSQNLIEKMTQRHCLGLRQGQLVHAGDFVRVRPTHVMTHDNTGAVIPKFDSLGVNAVLDSAQPVFALDHDVQNKSASNVAKYEKIEAFAKHHGIAFFAAGRGIGHQLMLEEGFALPGTMVVASDSHANIYGAVAALGTPVVRTDAAAIWACGETWWQIPPVVRVNLQGELAAGVSGKDVILALIGHFAEDQVLNCAVEFVGEGVAHLSMDQRMAISNMSTEWGALAGVFAYDDVTGKYLRTRAHSMLHRSNEKPRISLALIEKIEKDAICADDDAHYNAELSLDLASVVPLVAGPDMVKRTRTLADVEEQKIDIDRAYLLSCVGGRLEDIAAAAVAMKGRKVASRVKFYLAAASAEIEAQAKKAGYWQSLLDAGAIAFAPGCGACIGLGEGLLEAGEVGISATNRNFKGRMGSRDAQVYLASPAVVAASAVAGYIVGPEKARSGSLRASYQLNKNQDAVATATEMIEGFPTQLQGRMLLLPADNLNTDGIYGKEYTYKDDMTADEMAQVVMLNYDPEFQKLAQHGDIIVAGNNFGSGSSREQAATALKYRGIQLVIAASFSQTYKRNAFNNGFIVLECPTLVDVLRARFTNTKMATIVTDVQASIDFSQGNIVVEGSRYAFAALGPAAQELIVAQGLEALVRQRMLG